MTTLTTQLDEIRKRLENVGGDFKLYSGCGKKPGPTSDDIRRLLLMLDLALEKIDHLAWWRENNDKSGFSRKKYHATVREQLAAIGEL